MAASPVTDQAFVTLATNDTYCMGALVLANSLRQAGTSRQIAVMITDQVTQGMREQLNAVFDNIVTVDVLDSRDTMNLDLLTRPDLGVTFTKFHCWRLTQYNKCVFLDADTFVLTNVDELFDREELSAAPDAGWPDCFNSGVFVYVPSEETYRSLLQFAVTQGSFDGGDQGLLNLYFKDWATADIKRHLPFIYNCVSQAFYSYLPAFKQFGKDVKIVHFIGAVKPWHHAFNTATGDVQVQSDPGHHSSFLQQWWNTFMSAVQPKLDPSLCHLVTIFEYYSQPYPPPPPQPINPHHHSDTVTSYVHTEPYQPPQVEVYYNPPQPQQSESPPQHFEPIVVETDPSRHYEHYETHYSEPPMEKAAEYASHREAYHAHNFDSKWTDFNVDQRQSQEREEESKNKQDSNENAQHSEEIPNQEVQNENNAQNDSVLENEVDQNGSVLRGDTEGVVDGEADEEQADSSTSVSEGLSSLRITPGPEGYTKAQLDDTKRSRMWERGQIDYTGIDKFDNIQNKLDEVLTSPPPEPTDIFTKTPFSKS